MLLYMKVTKARTGWLVALIIILQQDYKTKPHANTLTCHPEPAAFVQLSPLQEPVREVPGRLCGSQSSWHKQLEQNLACHLFPLSTSPGNNKLKVIILVWHSYYSLIQTFFTLRLSSNTIRANIWSSVTETQEQSCNWSWLYQKRFNTGRVLRKPPLNWLSEIW